MAELEMKVKLFVIQVYEGSTWNSVWEYRGTLRQAMEHAGSVYWNTDFCIKRVKTLAEWVKMDTLPLYWAENGTQIWEWTEWVN